MTTATLFLIEGLPSVLPGVLAFTQLADHPAPAPWLSDDEKLRVARALEADQAALLPRQRVFRTA